VRRSLTLLELLIVVFILAALAASAVSLTGEADGQARQTLTTSRRQQVREAIVGPARQVDQRPVLTGFVADMGRLPRNVQELLAPPAEGTHLFAHNATYAASAGWRGPYLRGTWEANAATSSPAFRDGWSTVSQTDDATNYGWQVVLDVSDGTYFDLISYGRDGVAGGVGLDTDQPAYPAPLPSPAPRLVTPSDWSVDLAAAPERVELEIFNDTGAPLDPLSVRLRVVIPSFEPGSPADWSVGGLAAWSLEKTTRADISDVGSGAATIAVGGSARVSFDFSNALPRIPQGRWALAVIRDSDGVPLGPVDEGHAPILLPVTVLPRSAWIKPAACTFARVRTP